MLALILFLAMLLPAIWLTDSLSFLIHLFSFPHFPWWLNVAIGLSVLSWLMRD
jgi:hypothetical protein